MMDNGPAKRVSLFQLGSHRLTLLRRSDGLIYLNALSGDFPISLGLVAAAHPAVLPLAELCEKQSASCLVPLPQLTAVRDLLAAVKDAGLEVRIQRAVAAMRQITYREAPVLQFSWQGGEGVLRRGDSPKYHGQGWFSHGSKFWQWPSSRADDDYWLNLPAIGRGELLTFTREVLPAWRKLGRVVESELCYSRQPLQLFRPQQVTARQLALSLTWLDQPAAQPTAVPGLPGFLLVLGSLRPGLERQFLEQFTGGEQQLLLSGEDIPRFLQALGQQPQLLLSDPDGQVGRVHQLYQGTGRLLLECQRDTRRGIGTVHAVPTFQIAGCNHPAAELSRKLADATDFLRVAGGWVSRAQLEAVGIASFGRLKNGHTLDPISLTPLEIIWRGSQRLSGPWDELESLNIELPTAGKPEEIAREHLFFLRSLGLPGGLLGTVNRDAKTVLAFLLQHLREQPEARVLIVGSKTVLNYLSKLAPSGKLLRLDQQPAGMSMAGLAPGMVAVTPNWLERAVELEQSEWDILFLVNADSLIKSRSSALYRRLYSLHKLLVLGLFNDLGFRQRHAARSALAELMGLEEASPQLLWRFLLRDPLETPRELLAPATATRFGRLTPVAEYQLMPVGVPDRSLTTSYQAERLVNAASILVQQLRDKQVLPVPFVPYYQPWPTLNSMNRDQLSWYIYWRDRVRQGEYLDTGLDYITLYCFELLNQVGVKDAEQGYRELYQLWSAYRGRFPSLDHRLLHWLVDYLLENGLSIDPLAPYRSALALGVTVPAVDQLLQPYTALAWEALPPELLACLSNYQWSRSRFCLAGQQAQLEQAVASALSVVDDYYRERFGQGLWQFYEPRRRRLEQRRLFQHALYAGKSRLINFGSVFPYSEQGALRALVTAVIKHTENILRQRQSYRGKLRTDALPAELIARIDSYLKRPSRPTRTPVGRITIDQQQVRRLTAESNEVRDLLLALSAGSEETAPEVELKSIVEVRVAAQPDGTEEQSRPTPAAGAMAPWPRLLRKLTPTERQALSVIAHGGDGGSWQQFCRQAGVLPGMLIDQINALSLAEIGDLLLTDQSGQPEILPEYQLAVMEQLALEER